MPTDDTKALPLLAAYRFAADHGLGSEAQRIREMPADSSVRRGYFVEVFEKAGLFDEFCGQHWSFSATTEGKRKLSRYRRLQERHGEDAVEEPESIEESDLSDESQAFALEAHLRDFLSENLERVEPGLKLYATSSRNGIEFLVDNGRIDLLAIDRAGKFVVIELKLSRGRNKTLGQILYYMAWVDQNLGNGPCRGYIIANEIPEELRVAVARVSGLQLAEYHLSFAIHPVAS